MTYRFDANLGWLFTEVPFEERFERAAQAGFAGVEYPSPYDHTPVQVQKFLADAGLVQVLINTPQGPIGTPTRWGLASLPDEVEQFRAGFQKALEYAVALDSKFVHVCAGSPPPDVSRDRAFAFYVANVIWSAELAKDTNVTLLLESQNKADSPGFILDNQQQAIDAVDAVGRANVRLLFDVYHAGRVENDVVSSLESSWDRIAHIQIADTPARHQPGTGDVPWPEVFSVIAKRNYSGWIGCEYAPDGDPASSFEWMETLDR